MYFEGEKKSGGKESEESKGGRKKKIKLSRILGRLLERESSVTYLLPFRFLPGSASVANFPSKFQFVILARST